MKLFNKKPDKKIIQRKKEYLIEFIHSKLDIYSTIEGQLPDYTPDTSHIFIFDAASDVLSELESYKFGHINTKRLYNAIESKISRLNVNESNKFYKSAKKLAKILKKINNKVDKLIIAESKIN